MPRFSALSIVGFLVACVCGATSASAYSGLDQRPVNSGANACVAFAKPTVGGAALQTILPAGLAFHWVKSPLPNEANVWYVIESRRKIRRWTVGQTLGQAPVIADFTSRVGVLSNPWTGRQGGSEEWGVVSFALHPKFADPTNPKRLVYVVYTGKQVDDSNLPDAQRAPVTSHLVEVPMTSAGTLDLTRERILLQHTQTQQPWHHFDNVIFGPDGYLYMTMGDGGSSDRSQNKQQIQNGKMLRLDVDARMDGKPYGYPADNPFATDPSFAPEVFAYGLRNPWRFSIDVEPGTGKTTIWLGDVGLNNREEVSIVTKSANMGWPIYEGNECRNGPCNTTGLTMPVHDYTHAVGSAVIGGFVYRGSDPDLAWLKGRFVFGDWSTPTVYYLEPTGSTYERRVLTSLPNGLTVSNFAQDFDKNIYVVGVRGLNPDGFFKLVGSSTGAIETAPQLISQTNCVNMADPRRPAPGTIPYTVAQPLWSDSASKYRFVAFPDGTRATVNPQTLDIDVPNGTVFVKTFVMADIGKPHETRLLMRFTDGTWGGYSYRWNVAGTEANLVPQEGQVDLALPYSTAGGTVPASIPWNFPSRDACWRCHTAVAGVSLGAEVAQLNEWAWYPTGAAGRTANQLDTWQAIGVLGPLPKPRQSLPALAQRRQTGNSPIIEARSYLHSNCSFCHRPNGTPQANVDFRDFTVNNGGHYLQVHAGQFCNYDPGVADGTLGIPGAKILKPGSPDESIIRVRMSRRVTDYANGLIHTQQMPPLATIWQDRWPLYTVFPAYINTPNVCQIFSSSARDSATEDKDGVPQGADNCTRDFNPAQYDFDGDGYGQACDADLNNDGVVNDADQAILTATMNSSRGQSKFNQNADFNADDAINGEDQTIFDRLRLRGTPGPRGFTPL